MNREKHNFQSGGAAWINYRKYLISMGSFTKSRMINFYVSVMHLVMILIRWKSEPGERADIYDFYDQQQKRKYKENSHFILDR